MKANKPALTFVLGLVCASPGRGQFLEELELTASNGVAGDRFASDVLLDGDTAFIGAAGVVTGSLSRGVVYVLGRDVGGPGAWGELMEIVPSSSNPFPDGIGEALALDGDLLAVGSPYGTPEGAVFLFERDAGGPGAWGQVKVIHPPTSSTRNSFGLSVAIQGEVLAVGASGDTANGFNAGSAHLFQRDLGGTNNWGLVKTIIPANNQINDSFGWRVAVEGNTLAVSAEGRDFAGASSGSVYVFERNQGGSNAWGQVIEFAGDDTAAADSFGWSLDLDGTLLAVGAIDDDDHGSSSGSAYLFDGDNGWSQVAKVSAADGQTFDGLGTDLALSDSRLAVAALRANGDKGAHYVFERDHGGAGEWGQVAKITSPGSIAFDSYGRVVALQGTTLFAGDEEHDDTGAAYAYQLPEPVRYCTAGTSASGCQAAISATGVPSASAASGFELHAFGVEGAKDGLFFLGTSGRQANAWGNGSSLQCIVPPVQRAGLLTGSGSAGACDGAFTQDLNARWQIKPNQNPGAGAVVQAQLWYRDPSNTSNQPTSMSDAVEFAVGP